MICIYCVSRELRVFKLIIIYIFLLEFIDNKKQLEEGDKVDNDVYISHV
jgi:hypothetical protein